MPCYPARLRRASRPSMVRAEKMLLTDFCNRRTTRAPVDRSTCPKRAAFAERPPPRPRPAVQGNPSRSASERPCGLRTPGGSALDDAFPAATRSHRASSLTGGLDVVFDASAPRRFRPRARPGNGPLTLPVAPRLAQSPERFAMPEPLPPTARQRDRLCRPGAPSLDKCSPEREPATGPTALPPMVRLPALLRSPTLSRERARPERRPAGLFTRRREGPRTACRLLQPTRSASTIPDLPNPANRTGGRPPVQPCERDLRAAMPPDASLDLGRRTCVRHLARPNLGRPAHLRTTLVTRVAASVLSDRAANREVTGQGPRGAVAPFWLLPPRSLAARASPQPDRLEHLLSRARDDAGWRGRRHRAS